VEVSVVTVDDQAVFRETAREVIEATPGFAAVGEASGGEGGLELVDRLEPQLVLMDVRMPGMDGIEAAARIKESHPGTVVILITIEDAAHVPESAAKSAAEALVRKQDFKPALLRNLWEEFGHAVGRR
jgi:two-component system, NarL family, invasion response regulator UvrY